MKTLDQLYKEPLEPRKLTPEEAFEAGKRGDLTEYDAAARKLGRIYYEAASRNCAIGSVLGHVLELNDKFTPEEKAVRSHDIWQDHFLDLGNFFEYALEKEEPDSYRMSQELGPSGFMFGWALQAAAEALREAGGIDSVHWPTKGHVEERDQAGRCRRCHIPVK